MQTFNESTPVCTDLGFTHSNMSYLYTICYHILLPIFTANGVIGNIFNLIILRAKRVRLSMGSFEKRTNYGLIALAVSDMFMCLFAFPTSLLFDAHVPCVPGFSYYYQLYCKAIINVFIMSSTWLTITLAAERYIAICHAFKAQSFLKSSRTLFAIAFVFVFSALFNIPYLWKMKAIPHCHIQGTVHYLIIEKDFPTKRFEHTMRVLWAVLGNFTPLILLAYFNFRLMLEIHKAYKCRHQHMNNSIPAFSDVGASNNNGSSNKHRILFKLNIRNNTNNNNNCSSQQQLRQKQQNPAQTPNSCSEKFKNGIYNQQSQDMSFRITLTLVAIVVMFLILVAPSEAVKHILYLMEGNSYSENELYQRAEVVTNTMQTLNFSVNFIVYCCIIKSFRRTLRHIILDRIGRQCQRFLIRFRKLCAAQSAESEFDSIEEVNPPVSIGNCDMNNPIAEPGAIQGGLRRKQMSHPQLPLTAGSRWTDQFLWKNGRVPAPAQQLLHEGYKLESKSERHKKSSRSLVNRSNNYDGLNYSSSRSFNTQ